MDLTDWCGDFEPEQSDREIIQELNKALSDNNPDVFEPEAEPETEPEPFSPGFLQGAYNYLKLFKADGTRKEQKKDK